MHSVMKDCTKTRAATPRLAWIFPALQLPDRLAELRRLLVLVRSHGLQRAVLPGLILQVPLVAHAGRMPSLASAHHLLFGLRHGVVADAALAGLEAHGCCVAVLVNNCGRRAV